MAFFQPAIITATTSTLVVTVSADAQATTMADLYAPWIASPLGRVTAPLKERLDRTKPQSHGRPSARSEQDRVLRPRYPHFHPRAHTPTTARLRILPLGHPG